MVEAFDTAVFVPGRGLYTFADDLVWRYGDGRLVPDPGFPKPITAEFPGAFPRRVDAALVHPDGDLFFFRGPDHIRYDLANRRPVIGYPRQYAQDWPGVFPDRIDAALTWDLDIIYLFGNHRYTSFSPRRRHARPGFPKAIVGNWPGLRSSPLLAALALPDGRRVLITGSQAQAYDRDGQALEGELPGLPISAPAARYTAQQTHRQGVAPPVYLRSQRFRQSPALSDLQAVANGKLRLGRPGDPPHPAPIRSSGPAVKEVQQALTDLGWLRRSGTDGRYGNETYQAVLAYKRRYGIGTATGYLDGIVGPKTIQHIDAALPLPACPVPGRKALIGGRPGLLLPAAEAAEAEGSTPGPVDTAAAAPPFDLAERARVVEPLLSAQASAKAVTWNNTMHPGSSGVTLDQIRDALRSYVDAAAVQLKIERHNKQYPGQPIGASTSATDAVLAECVHQFQKKCYCDEGAHDGQAGESTLDSLGLIIRAGPGFHGGLRRNARAQERLTQHDEQVQAATSHEFSGASWFGGVIDPSVFGMRTKGHNGLHVLLVRKLRQAERYLLTLAAFRGKTPAALGQALGLTERHGGMRPDKTGSMHTFGLAIDIEYKANPWVRQPASWQAMKHAALLISGINLTAKSAPEYFSTLGSDPARSTGQIWDELQQRDTELIAYFKLGQDATALRTALLAGRGRGTAGLVDSGQSVDQAVTRWRAQIQDERKTLAAGDGDFCNRDPGRGFLTHQRHLVIALRDYGCLAWGAVDQGPNAWGSGDMMHFDARIDGVGRVLARGTKKGEWLNYMPRPGHHPCLPTSASSAETMPAGESESEDIAPSRDRFAVVSSAVRALPRAVAGVLAGLRSLGPAEMCRLAGDPGLIGALANHLSGAELAEAGAQLARGRVTSMGRADLGRIIAAPSIHTLGALAGAYGRDMLLAHHEAYDHTGTGAIHGNRSGVPKPAGAVSTDCTGYVLTVLDRVFAAKGLAAEWQAVRRTATNNSRPGGLKGTEVIKALQADRKWQAVFWAPDPTDPADHDGEHPFAYRKVRTEHTYYGINVNPARPVVNYRRTTPSHQVDLTGIRRLQRLQFGLLAARGGTHMAMIVNGEVHEVHWERPATSRDAITATPLETFDWQSGVIAAPPGDLDLAWRMP